MNMTLRNQLKNAKIQNSDTMLSHFIRVAQIKELLEEIEENVEEGDIVMTTFNGLPRSWDSFIQGLCAKRRLISFNRLWEECTQEEARVITKEEKMGSIVDQALIVHSKRNHRKKEDHHHNKRQKEFIRDPSNIICYTCDEKGHYSRDCPRNKCSFNKEEKEYSSSDEEYEFYW